MLFVGIALIALEVFVIPGFGIAGVTGITCTVGALIFIMLGNDNFNFDFVPDKEITTAATVVGVGIFGSVVLLFVLGYRFTQSNMFKRVALVNTQDKEDGYVATFYKKDLVGQEGIAITILRPSGRIEIEDDIYDAYTHGEYIEKGEKVK